MKNGNALWWSVRLRRLAVVSAVVGSCLLSPAVARAQSYKLLHSFNPVPAGADGALPSGDLIQASDGFIYGAIATGGANGAGVVFRMDAAGAITPLHSFTNPDAVDGYEPQGLIQGIDGEFYGTTRLGGKGLGTVFQMTSAGIVTTLHVFDPLDGGPPAGSLIQAKDHNFYGTTSTSGPSLGDQGTIFRITSAGSFAVLHAFPGSGTSEGRKPLAGLLQASDDNFYGTTTGGGANGYGTVFKMDTAGTTVTTVHSFTQTGGVPEGSRGSLIQAADTNLYGTTLRGGANGTGVGGYGTVFKMNTSGTSYATLHSFASTDGRVPAARVMQGRDGNFYGTTSEGGPSNGGSVFRMDAAGNVTTLHFFAVTDGFQPLAGVIQATNGMFYGTTRSGGSASVGVVFRIETTTAADLDADFKTDRTIFRPTTGAWFSLLSGGGATATSFGTTGDVDVPADYDGDGKADIAVWRPSTGAWFILQSKDSSLRAVGWGTTGDIPIAGDVDGDGKADLVVFRPATGAWFINKSGGGSAAIGFGTTGDQPLLADYDGDGKADLTVFRPSTGAWYIAKSAGGGVATGFGATGDIPITGDWDGDSLADLAVFRPSSGVWFVSLSSGGGLAVSWGGAGDIPLVGDFDGDGKSDFTVWRPSTGAWFTQFAVGGSAAVGFGTTGDKPIGRVPGS